MAPGEFLDCVAVGSEAQWGCSGILIAPNAVITAGHCKDFATRVFFGHDVTKPGKIARVRKRLRHPDYHKISHNDLMVLILDHAIDSIAPRAIAPKALIDRATWARVLGFGSSDPSGLGFGVKRSVDVLVMSPACAGKTDGQLDSERYGCDRGSELVAGDPLRQRDSGMGDAGGPLYVPDGNGRLLVAGSTSRAIDSSTQMSGDGGIYVRVDRYRKWIDSIPGVTLV